MKRILAMLLAAVLAMTATACAGKKSGGAGTTPEATVETFLDALRRQDLDAMLKCCYIEDYCNAYDFQKGTTNNGFMQFTSPEAPTQYPLYREAMEIERRGMMTNRIRLLASSLAMQRGDAGAWEAYKEQYIRTSQIAFPPKENDRREEIVADFIKAVDPDGLRDLRVTQIQRFQPEDEKQKASFERQAENWGRKQVAEVHVTMELGEAVFQKGFTLVEVNDRWQIALFFGVFLSDDGSLGPARRIN